MKLLRACLVSGVTHVLSCCILLVCEGSAQSLPGEAVEWNVIPGETELIPGGFTSTARFGEAIAGWRSSSSAGTTTLAVGSKGLPIGGAVWVLSINTELTISDSFRIADGQAGFSGPLAVADLFGASLAALGDIDGDGVGDLAVGATGDSGAAPFVGAMWILMLTRDAHVKSAIRISRDAGGFTGDLDGNTDFGASVVAIGDLDGNGVTDIAVGAPKTGDSGADAGAVWILFLEKSGTVIHQQIISGPKGDFLGDLDPGDSFGASLTTLPRPGDQFGRRVLLVGAPGDDDWGIDRGCVWVLRLNADGTVSKATKLSAATNGMIAAATDPGEYFGCSVSALGDVDGNGTCDVAFGSRKYTNQQDPGPHGFPELQRGAVYVGFTSDGPPASPDDGIAMIRLERLSENEGGMTVDFFEGYGFGHVVAGVGDLNGDGIPDVAAAPKAVVNDVWLIALNAAIWKSLPCRGSLGRGMTLSGIGSLVAREPVSIALSGADGHSRGLLAIWPDQALERGCIAGVPRLDDAVVIPFETDVDGRWSEEGHWPVGIPSHSDFFFRAFARSKLPHVEFTSSNGLMATTP